LTSVIFMGACLKEEPKGIVDKAVYI
jgi:hypothetical protein